MKKNFLVAFISILIISTMAYATSYVIHDYDTGIMHMAQDIYLTNTNSVQTQIDSIETSLNGNYVLKSGSITQIATRNHNDLQNITGNGTVHLSASEKLNYDTAYSHSQNTTSAHGLTISDVALKSGSLSQFTTRNASDINVTATSYGKGLAATDVNLQKVSDRVNQNGTPQFVTDKTKCSLLLDFNGTLTDKTAGINPIGFDSANKWVDNFVNDSTTKANATNISCTLKQFQGDEGKFGSGVAVEESRTNLWTNSEDLTIATGKDNCTIAFDRVLPDGRKLYKLIVIADGNIDFYKSVITTATTYAFSMDIASYSNGVFDMNGVPITLSSNLTRKSITKLVSAGTTFFAFDAFGCKAGDTFYITSPQIEVGAFPTSYIATGATAVTRPAGKLNFDPKIVDNLTDFTISLWAKPNFNYNYSQSMRLFRMTGATANQHIQLVYYGATKKYQMYFGDSSIIATTAYTSNTDLQKWNHFICKKIGATGYLYLNNVLIGTTAAINCICSNFYIGTFGPTDASNSIISNFAIFNYALTADEIAQIYNSGLEGKPVVTTNPQNTIPVGQSLYDTLFTTYSSGWGISSTYPNKPTFSKNDNVAMLRGILGYSGTVNSDTTLFTLPVGARPSIPDTYFNSFIVSSRDSGAPSVRIIRVYGNGNVVLMANGATITNPAISLDNINYVNGK